MVWLPLLSLPLVRAGAAATHTQRPRDHGTRLLVLSEKCEKASAKRVESMLVAGALLAAALSVVQLHPPRVLERLRTRRSRYLSATTCASPCSVAMPAQEALVHEALSSTAPIGPGGRPIWVCAGPQHRCGRFHRRVTRRRRCDASFLELGAGTGLCSLTTLAGLKVDSRLQGGTLGADA